MLRNIIGKTGWLSAVLCFILMVTTVLPFGVGVVYANGGLNFIGIPNNTSATNPHIHYSPEITIKGTYPTDVNGEDLRYEVTSLSGSQPTDTSSIRPAIDAATRTFTFRNIELMPGVNKISFSYRGDDSNTDLSSVYVQYNNTPLFSELRIDSVNLDSDPTVVEVNSTRNLTLDLSGIAVNATSVRATNKTTGETFSDDTNSSGRFSIELEALVGLNEIDIYAYSQNREVGLVNRSILVVPSGNAQGGSDQFYNVKIGNTPLTEIPPAKTELLSTGEITGKLLLKVPTGATVLDANVKDSTPPDAPAQLTAVTDTTTDKTTVRGIAESDAKITVIAPTGDPYTGDAKADGSFSFEITGQPEGALLTLTAADADSNVSESANVRVTTGTVTPEPSKPSPPSLDPDMNNFLVSDTIIEGQIPTAYSTVTVKRGATELGSGSADANGNFRVVIPPQTIGDKLSVTYSDGVNDSEAAVVTVMAENTLQLQVNSLDQQASPVPISAQTFELDTDHQLPSEYRLYDVKATLGSGLDHNKAYELQVTYQTVRKDPDNLSNIVNDVTVENYSYQFIYKSSTNPRFGVVRDISNPDVTSQNAPLIKTDGSVNIINMLPAKVEMEAFNMETGNFKVFYNNTEKSLNQDYTLTLPTLPEDKLKIEFINLPVSETTIKVVYEEGTNEEEISFKLKPEVAPSLLFYYTASGQTKVIDSTLDITDPNVSNFASTFMGKLYNYKLTADPSDPDDLDKRNMVITLNGDDEHPIRYEITNDFEFTIDRDEFTVSQSGQTKWNFKQGSNTLVFSLKDDPSVKFTYTIIYNTTKTPKVEDVTLKVIQGKNDEEELKKTSTDSAYQTSAYFLSELSFEVANVDYNEKEKPIVTIKKDGNVIAKYELQNNSGDWKFLHDDSDYKRTRDDAIEGNTRDLGNIFDATTFSEAENIRSKFSFSAEMDADEYGEELVGELNDMGLSSDELDDRLKRFPLTLAKGGTTNYQIEVTQGSIITRHNISIGQDTQAWTVISPTKSDNAEYITVNSNSVPIKIFAENATKVTFGKEEAVAYNTTEPDYEYDPDTGKLIPETYYVFEKNVTLKKGLNTIKFTVAFGENEYDDEIKIYNVNSSVGGAEYREILGKKTSFSVFDKSFELKFPTGTVLLAPAGERAGNEVHQPDRDIFTDVTLYFGIADRTNGRVSLDDNRLRDEMEDLMTSEIDTRDFNYASPLYYVDAGNAPPAGEDDDDEERAPGGRDPYYDGTINDIVMEPFIERWEYNLVPSKEGTVTIKYDSSIVNAANTVLTVFYNNGDEWTNIGGVVSTSKQTITVPFAGFGYYMVMMTRETFSDVITHPFARDAIETLYAKGIMVDAPGSGFGTELNIRRGEFATMLVKALDLPINAGPYDSSGDPTAATFRDVHPDLDEWDYEYEYIETAARAGIVRGKDISSFEPDSWLTREEAAIMISRALNLKTGAVEAAQTQLGKMFTDAQLTGYYAAPSVLAVAKAKIMNGEPNDETAKKPTYRFNPRGELTRAEMAVITVRIMQQLKKLPKQ